MLEISRQLGFMGVMKVYRLFHTVEAPEIASTPDPDKFAYEVLSDLTKLTADTSVGSFQLLDPTVKVEGFFHLSNKVLVFTKDVYLGPMGYALGFAGNVHSAKLNDTGEEISFLNVTACYNCLDRERTVFHTSRGEELGVDHGKGVKTPAVFPKLIGDSWIFRIPQMRYAIFVASDGSGSEEDFYTLYRESGMRTFRFEEVLGE